VPLGQIKHGASSTAECPRAPAADRHSTLGPTINRSGTQNDQWLATVYDDRREWSLVK